MEALYSKLYDKYTKLKAKRDSEIDKTNRDQEVKFINYVSAADELIEHLRNENDRLRSEINHLRSEMASVRSAKDAQHVEFQRLLMEENEKNRSMRQMIGTGVESQGLYHLLLHPTPVACLSITDSPSLLHSRQDKNLSKEIERLQSLWHEGLCRIESEDKTEIESHNLSGNAQNGSDTCNALDVNTKRKRSRHYGSAAEVTVTPCAGDKLGHAPVGESASDLSKQTVFSGTGLVIDQPECCRRKVDLRGGGLNVTGPVSCIFKDLIECLVGMRLSTIVQTDGICVSALHQSSGYSFSLTWINKADGEELEIVYRVVSLGTFERVAPEWMREVLMFSMKMCPVFFERISRVIKLHQ